MSESTWIMCTNCFEELHCGGCGVPYIPPPLTCNCGQCGRMHDSDCAVHNEPRGACDCVVEYATGGVVTDPERFMVGEETP